MLLVADGKQCWHIELCTFFPSFSLPLCCLFILNSFCKYTRMQLKIQHHFRGVTNTRGHVNKLQSEKWIYFMQFTPAPLLQWTNSITISFSCISNYDDWRRRIFFSCQLYLLFFSRCPKTDANTTMLYEPRVHIHFLWIDARKKQICFHCVCLRRNVVGFVWAREERAIAINFVCDFCMWRIGFCVCTYGPLVMCFYLSGSGVAFFRWLDQTKKSCIHNTNID